MFGGEFLNFLFVVVGFFGCFVLDVSNAFGKALVILHTNTPYLSSDLLQ